MWSNQYQIAHDNIIHDTIEGEVILLNLETGTYYQLKDNGVPIWNELTHGASIAEIAAPLLAQYPAQAQTIQQELTRFVHELEAEDLIRPRAPEPTAPREPLTRDAFVETNGIFAAPVLLKYTDMQTLLLLDPIHDVGAQGWPLANPNESA